MGEREGLEDELKYAPGTTVALKVCSRKLSGDRTLYVDRPEQASILSVLTGPWKRKRWPAEKPCISEVRLQVSGKILASS